MRSPSVIIRRFLGAARSYLTDLWSRREFAWYLAVGNLKARNASTILGLFWWVLNPALLGAVYWFVFGVMFTRGEGEFGGVTFLVYLLSGMFPFYFTRTAMTGGVNSIVSNTQLLANLHFPRAVLPIASLIEGFMGFLSSLLAYFLIVGPVEGVWPTANMIILIPVMVIHLAFNLGLSMLVARLAVPFRDLNNLVPYMTRIWLYTSPILYAKATIADAPDLALRLVELNPLVPILRLYRYALAGIETDLASAFLGASIWAVVFLVGGALWFIKYEGRIARYV